MLCGKRGVLVSKLVLILLFLCKFTLAQTNNIAEVSAITNFKPNLYIGKWYEIARIPMYFEKNCIAPITAEYKINKEHISITNTCRLVSDEYGVASGDAYFTGATNIAKLKVTFLPKWLRFTHLAQADYWILYTDYQYALVGNPNRKYLWILSRTENFNANKITQLVNLAKSEGYDISLLQFNYVYQALLKESVN